MKNLELTNPFQLTIFLFISTSLGALGYRNWVLTSFGNGKMLGEKFRLFVRLEGHRDLFTFLAVISETEVARYIAVSNLCGCSQRRLGARRQWLSLPTHLRFHCHDIGRSNRDDCSDH